MQFLRQRFSRFPESTGYTVASEARIYPAPAQDPDKVVLIDAETGQTYTLPRNFGDEPVAVRWGEIDADAGVDPSL